ncbi:MAG: pyruvate kinase [Patescibacteria group bacterium]|jgi:pyruvate kinase
MYIIATISKSSYPANKIEEIITAGATVLRYNFAHGSPQELKTKIDIARPVIAKLGLENKIKILADLPGSKVRLGDFAAKEYPVVKDQELTFASKDFSPDLAEYVPVAFPAVGTLVKKGQIFTLADGEIAFVVTSIVDQDSFKARALNTNAILNMKGINIGEKIDQLDHFNEKTLNHIKNLAQIKPDWVAFSFVNSRDYLIKAKKLLAEVTTKDWQPLIVSKIESPLGLKNIKEIIKETDIIMVARGDLGLTMPFENLGISQKEIVRQTKAAGKPVIVATQILASIVSSYVPTRAEILDLTNLVLDGVDGMMLSRETGISLTPGHSIQVAKKIIAAAENFKNLN